MKLVMNSLSALALSFFVAGHVPAFGADAENKAAASTETSTNPLTGTKTTTKKAKHKVKGSAGKGEAETKETVKQKTDGTMETEKKETSESKPQ